LETGDVKVAVVLGVCIVLGGLMMPKRISKSDIIALEQRIAAGMTTAADVELMRRIVEQAKGDVAASKR
jgi:hypothetical protein